MSNLSYIEALWKSDPKLRLNDSNITSNQKFLNTPKEPLAKDLFNQVSSKSIELCRQRRVLNIFEQLPQMTLYDLWPCMTLKVSLIYLKCHQNHSCESEPNQSIWKSDPKLAFDF